MTLLNNEIVTLTLVCGVYLGATWVFKKTKLSLLHPLLVAIVVLGAGLQLFDVTYETFQRNSRLLTFLLGPSVVSLGFLLYEQADKLKARAVAILVSVFLGSLTGLISVVVIARWFGADAALVASLEPKSVTTPIAVLVSARSGGSVALTAVVGILVGIFGATVGPWLMTKLRVKSRLAKGLALGSAAHGLGTARAMELGLLEGAMGGLAIGLMGVMTALLVPLLHHFY